MSSTEAAAVVAANPVQAKIHAARAEMVSKLVERDTEIDLAFIAMLSGEHLLLVGPPGCGKSLMLDSVMNFMDGKGFSLLMTKYTMPEELFGPFSLRELENDRFVRVTHGKLPEADFGYLDEVFKCSPSILNTLLRIMNEGTYDRGAGAYKVPLKLLVASSNEYPRDDDGLQAMLDRFLIRRNVRAVATSVGKHRLLWGGNHVPQFTSKMTALELEQARHEVSQVTWSDDAKRCLDKIIGKLHSEGIMPSDRRMVKSLRVCQANAYYAGETEIEEEHLEVLSHVLWDDPQDQPQKCASIVSSTCNPVLYEVNGLLVEAHQVSGSVKDSNSEVQAATASKKLKEIQNKLKNLKDHPRVKVAKDEVAGMLKELRLKAMGADNDD